MYICINYYKLLEKLFCILNEKFNASIYNTNNTIYTYTYIH